VPEVIADRSRIRACAYSHRPALGFDELTKEYAPWPMLGARGRGHWKQCLTEPGMTANLDPPRRAMACA